jgi:hypothetical protein
MASSRTTPVEGVDEFRKRIGTVLRGFRANAGDAAPVIFGSNRRPEAAVVPFARLVELEEAEERLENLALTFVAQQRREEPVIGSVSDFFREADLDPADYGVAGE